MEVRVVARCVDCRFYPWVPEAEPDLLPAHRCHPDLPMMRWTEETRDMKRDCEYFQAREDPVEKGKVQPADERKKTGGKGRSTGKADKK